MRIHQQKTITHGGKQRGKIVGGMAFSSNTVPTDVGAGNTFVPIGNGSVGHANYQLIPEETSGSEYFSIRGGSNVSLQKLTLVKGENFSLYLDWSIGLLSSNVSPLQIRLRVQKQAVTGEIVTISSTVLNTIQLPNGSITSSSSLIILNKGDGLYVELSNVDSTSPTEDIVVTSSMVMISE